MDLRHRPLNAAGVTFVELVVAAAIVGIITPVVVMFVARMTRDTRTVTAKLTAQDSTRAAMDQMELEITDMNDLLVAQEERIEFLVDSHRAAGYNPNALTARGVVRALDPDDDGDWETPPANLALLPIDGPLVFQGYGNDLDDDDDDNDGHADMRCVYYRSGGQLVREIYYNKALNATNFDEQKVLIRNCTRLLFAYAGSVNENRGNAGLDANGDGLIDDEEIDEAPQFATLQAGDNDGQIDTRSERAYVTNIGVLLGEDVNADGVEDSALKTEIYPPLLPYKNKYP